MRLRRVMNQLSQDQRLRELGKPFAKSIDNHIDRYYANVSKRDWERQTTP